MAEYTSLVLGTATGATVFFLTLVYMKAKARQNKQASFNFPNRTSAPESHAGELVGHR
jgi:hypothetical protein